jgi:WD40 repeat protein
MDLGLKIAALQEVLEGHTGDVNSTAWSPTSRDTLCSCSGDRKIRVWKVGASTPPSKPSPIETIAAHELYINSCAFNPSGDLLVTTSSDEKVKIWSTVSWTCVGKYVGVAESWP